jgi:hypothetical protein
MAHEVEHVWTTKAGLEAACLIMTSGGRKRHRCGYVAVPLGHPLHGVGYDEEHAELAPTADEAEIGKKSPLLVVTAGVGASRGKGALRCSPDVAFDVHGGLTYSGGGKGYPVAGDGWWFGFDCAHDGDGVIEPGEFDLGRGYARSLPYVIGECEHLAAQIVRVFPLAQGDASC